MQGKERLNQWMLKDYIKNIFMILIKFPVWLLQILFFWIPLKRNRIIIYSLKQHGYSCNLKYLNEYLNCKKPGLFEVLWVVRNHEDYKSLEEHNVSVAMLHSREHIFYRMRAGIVITNDEFYPMFLKRKRQLYINTWHGGVNYKKIGYAGLEFTNPIQKLIYRMNNPCPDCFVSGSKSFTETASIAFGFPKNIFLECGLPRNDILCQGKDIAGAAKIKMQLGIAPEKKVVLYAPTFRKGGFGPRVQMDYNTICTCLSHRFGGEWVMLLRQHYFVDSDLAQNANIVIDVSKYEDMQELILCSDCMISDYSSCMWDYLLTGNPCFVFAPDLDEYDGTDRSFFMPIAKWPYPIGRNMEALCKYIEEFDPVLFAERAERHKKECGSYDSGHACEKLTHVLENYK